MKQAYQDSIAELAEPLPRLRLLLYGFSGSGFPGGDGVAEAVKSLPSVGVDAVYTHQLDPELNDKLSRNYDIAIICNTRIGELFKAPRRLWTCAREPVLWFWDLRPGKVGQPLRGLVKRAFLSFNGSWLSPQGSPYVPSQWSERLGVPVGYCPQASPLRTPVQGPNPGRVVFIGDLANRTYHEGRNEICRDLGAIVRNAKDRNGRLGIEARMPEIYSSARYALSMSPRAPGYTSVRTYSILACGGLLLLHRFPGCERLFSDGEHAVIFNTSGDARARLEELDQDEEKRDRIATAGRLLHATTHTVTHRILSICRETTGVAEGFSGWL